MDKNNKLAFTIFAAAMVFSWLRFSSFRKEVEKFVAKTTIFVDNIVQEEYDKYFEEIVENYEE